jgi:hypothetical protein
MSISAGVSAPIQHTDRFFIGGEWVTPASDSTITVIAARPPLSRHATKRGSCHDDKPRNPVPRRRPGHQARADRRDRRDRAVELPADAVGLQVRPGAIAANQNLKTLYT